MSDVVRPSRMEPPPTHVAELALSCTEFVRRAIGSELDYTPDTLPILDQYLRQARGESREDIIRLLAPAAGAYFGEVLRKAFECRWHAPGTDYASWRLEFRGCFLYFNPIGMIVEAIQLEDTDGLGAALVTADEDVEDLREELANTAPVRLEDYYAVTTRFEVVDQIVHFLMVRRPDERSRSEYDADFYRAHASRDAAPEA